MHRQIPTFPDRLDGKVDFCNGSADFYAAFPKWLSRFERDGGRDGIAMLGQVTGVIANACDPFRGLDSSPNRKRVGR